MMCHRLLKYGYISMLDINFFSVRGIINEIILAKRGPVKECLIMTTIRALLIKEQIAIDIMRK
jgi:hypothetical protein